MKKNLKSWLSILQQNKQAVFTAFSLIILGDILFSTIHSDAFIFGVIVVYILLIKVFTLKSKTTFSFCFFILGLLFISLVFTGTSEHTEKAAVWLYFFMGMGIIQEVVIKVKYNRNK